MKPETRVDLEEMRSDVTNCHPHPMGIEREQQKSSREAEIDLDQRPRRENSSHCMLADSDSQATPELERLLPPPTISDPVIFQVGDL